VVPHCIRGHSKFLGQLLCGERLGMFQGHEHISPKSFELRELHRFH
jgi:hypothetical protein